MTVRDTCGEALTEPSVTVKDTCGEDALKVFGPRKSSRASASISSQEARFRPLEAFRTSLSSEPATVTAMLMSSRRKLLFLRFYRKKARLLQKKHKKHNLIKQVLIGLVRVPQ